MNRCFALLIAAVFIESSAEAGDDLGSIYEIAEHEISRGRVFVRIESGERSFRIARQLFSEGRIRDAAIIYREALENIPNAPLLKDLRNEILLRYTACVSQLVSRYCTSIPCDLKQRLIDDLERLIGEAKT